MNSMYFQEQIVWGDNRINKTLWKDVKCWMVKATKGYTSHLQLRRVGKGGTCILMDVRGRIKSQLGMTQ
jgi:hypothetical protein